MEILVLTFTAERIPICEFCGAEVVPDDEVKEVVSNQNYVKFMNETKSIVEILKKLDQITLPE